MPPVSCLFQRSFLLSLHPDSCSCLIWPLLSSRHRLVFPWWINSPLQLLIFLPPLHSIRAIGSSSIHPSLFPDPPPFSYGIPCSSFKASSSSSTINPVLSLLSCSRALSHELIHLHSPVGLHGPLLVLHLVLVITHPTLAHNGFPPLLYSFHALGMGLSLCVPSFHLVSKFPLLPDSNAEFGDFTQKPDHIHIRAFSRFGCRVPLAMWAVEYLLSALDGKRLYLVAHVKGDSHFLFKAWPFFPTTQHGHVGVLNLYSLHDLF